MTIAPICWLNSEHFPPLSVHAAFIRHLSLCLSLSSLVIPNLLQADSLQRVPCHCIPLTYPCRADTSSHHWSFSVSLRGKKWCCISYNRQHPNESGLEPDSMQRLLSGAEWSGLLVQRAGGETEPSSCVTGQWNYTSTMAQCSYLRYLSVRVHKPNDPVSYAWYFLAWIKLSLHLGIVENNFSSSSRL